VEALADQVKAAGPSPIVYATSFDRDTPPTQLTGDVVAQVPLAFLKEGMAAGQRWRRFSLPEHRIYSCMTSASRPVPRLMARRRQAAPSGCFPPWQATERYRLAPGADAEGSRWTRRIPPLVEYGTRFAELATRYWG